MCIDEYFKRASSHARTLSDVSEENILKLYGLYKQANEGLCNISKPYFWDFTATAKWKSWKSFSSLSSEEAKKKYIDLVKTLDITWNEKFEINTEHEIKKASGGFGLSVSMLQHEPEDEILDKNKTVFDWCEEGNMVELKKLINSNPELLKAVDNNQLTLLHWAVDRGFVNIVDYLISCNCDVNQQDVDKQTPLHYAVTCEHIDIIKILLKAGAGVSITDSDGNTPEFYARTKEIKAFFEPK